MTTEHFTNQANKNIRNKFLQQRLALITNEFINKRQTAVEKIPDWQEWRAAAQKIKSHSINHLDLYLETFEKNLIQAGGQVHWCQTGEEACEKILHICQKKNAKLVVKSKSMVAEEIALKEHLNKNNINLVETDLGDYILQIRGDKPSHSIAPALHIDKTMVAESFKKHHKNLSRHRVFNTTSDLIHEVRGLMRKNFLTADVGITGANFLVAESGSVILVTNEGNADLVASLPPTHIVITTIDKIVPTLYDASHLLRLLCRSATGQALTSYASFFTGIKQKDDSDGGDELHVILLNNNRTQLLAPSMRSALSCIKCGACLNHCPIYQTVGGNSYSGSQMGPIGAAIAPTIIGEKKANDMAFASTLCGRCDEICPVKIPISHLLRHQREWSFLQKNTDKKKQKMLRQFRDASQSVKKFRKTTHFIRKILRFYNRNGVIKKIPMLNITKNWFLKKDLPTPPKQSFLDRIKK
ncbi:MAG: lactate utilization protein B [Alphaproteobacteria bacterium]